MGKIKENEGKEHEGMTPAALEALRAQVAAQGEKVKEAKAVSLWASCHDKWAARK